MSLQRERHIRNTLFNLLEILQHDHGHLSRCTEEAIVHALEGLRWDYLRLLPESPVWDEYEGRLRRMSRSRKRRFESLVRQMLLEQTG